MVKGVKTNFNLVRDEYVRARRIYLWFQAARRVEYIRPGTQNERNAVTRYNKAANAWEGAQIKAKKQRAINRKNGRNVRNARSYHSVSSVIPHSIPRHLVFNRAFPQFRNLTPNQVREIARGPGGNLRRLFRN